MGIIFFFSFLNLYFSNKEHHTYNDWKGNWMANKETWIVREEKVRTKKINQNSQVATRRKERELNNQERESNSQERDPNGKNEFWTKKWNWNPQVSLKDSYNDKLNI